MNNTVTDIQALTKQAVASMKMALAAAATLKDGDLRDHQDVIWDLAMFEFLLHEDLDEYEGFNSRVESFLADHA